MAMATTTGGGLRAPLRPLVHVGGGVDRRAVYHEEQAALREALQRGTATIHGDRMLSSVVVTVSATSIVVHADAPNYRPPSTNLPKKERDERRHAKAGGGVATALAGTQTFSAQRVPVAAGSGRGGGVGRWDAAPRLQSGTVSTGRCVDPSGRT